MIAQLENAVEQLRMGMEGGGNAAMVSFIDAFQQALGGNAANMQLIKIVPVLQQIIQAQTRGDYLWVADILEYEILPLLRDH
ncbi:MAG: hypothetical protein GY847_04685 [Proteobacteria bacterium]|nr:hypothetical protein [Pseudomonadota bacterium]